MVRIEHGWWASTQVAGTRDVTDVDLKILHLVKDGRIVEQTLIIWVVGRTGAVERHRFARPRSKRPDVAIGQASKVTTGTVLPTLTREPFRLAAIEQPTG